MRCNRLSRITVPRVIALVWTRVCVWQNDISSSDGSLQGKCDKTCVRKTSSRKPSSDKTIDKTKSICPLGFMGCRTFVLAEKSIKSNTFFSVSVVEFTEFTSAKYKITTCSVIPNERLLIVLHIFRCCPLRTWLRQTSRNCNLMRPSDHCNERREEKKAKSNWWNITKLLTTYSCSKLVAVAFDIFHPMESRQRIKSMRIFFVGHLMLTAAKSSSSSSPLPRLMTSQRVKKTIAVRPNPTFRPQTNCARDQRHVECHFAKRKSLARAGTDHRRLHCGWTAGRGKRNIK